MRHMGQLSHLIQESRKTFGPLPSEVAKMEHFHRSKILII